VEGKNLAFLSIVTKLIMKESRTTYLSHLWYDQITIVERCRVELNKHIMIREFWEGDLLVEFQTVEPIHPLEGPAFGSLNRRHDSREFGEFIGVSLLSMRSSYFIGD
jgi:hypothetical protein